MSGLDAVVVLSGKNAIFGVKACTVYGLKIQQWFECLAM